MNERLAEVCAHGTMANLRNALLFRCVCGNTWIDGVFRGRLSPERAGVALARATR